MEVFFMPKATKKKTSGLGRTRNYATVIYTESAPKNWQSILGKLCIPAFLSPCHDKDISPDGEEKKAHWHLLVMFDGVKSENQAKEIFDLLGGVGCEKVNSSRGYARYLCHLDNPEKHQYSTDEVRTFSGLDYRSVISLPSDKLTVIKDMIMFIEKNNIYSFRQFHIYVMHHNETWYRALSDNCSYNIKEHLQSKYWEDFNETAKLHIPTKVDLKTGNIINIKTGEIIT
jgi:hypothetical protein